MMNRHGLEVGRYIINGLVATIAHYGALTLNLKILGIPSAGLSNLIAAIVGIGVSFLGNRYFVFSAPAAPIIAQALRFSALYCAIAVLHGLTLLVWADYYGLDYRPGFLIATAIQALLSYLGNKSLVFRAWGKSYAR